MTKRERKTLRFRTDILEALEAHKDRTGLSKQDTADVGVYLAIHLTRDSFQAIKDKVAKGAKITIDDIDLEK